VTLYTTSRDCLFKPSKFCTFDGLRYCAVSGTRSLGAEITSMAFTTPSPAILSTTAPPSPAPFHSETTTPYPTYLQSTTPLGFSQAPPGTPSPSPTKAPTSCASTSTPSAETKNSHKHTLPFEDVEIPAFLALF